jgi:hypothetical protein
MDQLWRELKGHISANYQYPTIEEHAAAAEQWIRSLTPTEALRKAGIRSNPTLTPTSTFEPVRKNHPD